MPPAPSPDAAAAAALAHPPPHIHTHAPVLAAQLALPRRPRVHYARFAAAPDLLDLARRHVLPRTPTPLLASVLASVHVDADAACLYAFVIASDDGDGDDPARARAPLDALARTQPFLALALTEAASFSPDDLYPCSPACAAQRTPCPNCLDPAAPRNSHPPPPSAPSSAPLLPREPLRAVYARFLDAVRDRLIDDMCAPAPAAPHTHDHDPRRLSRLQDGVLIFPPGGPRDWGLGWEHHVQNRPLIHCALHLHLSPARILVQPVFRPTHFLPLPAALPLPPGTPITLLPYATPAYYLATYAGPTAALTSQFSQSLAGRGCGPWAGPSPPPPPSPPSPHPSHADPHQHPTPSSSSASASPTYIIAWLAVQNGRGEDKGLPLIWPAALALASVPSSITGAAHRPPLHPLPELPTQLQPSPPPPPPPLVSLGAGSARSTPQPSQPAAIGAPPPPPPPTLPTLPLPTLPLSQQQQQQQQQQTTPSSTQPPLPPAIARRTRASPTADALRVFRTLSIGGGRSVRAVADEVAAYVDAVQRERERERERLRRERETANGGGGSGAPASSPAQAGTPAPPAPPLAPTPVPAAPTQPFYPSPPQSGNATATGALSSAPSASSLLASTTPTPIPVPVPPPAAPAPTPTPASAPPPAPEPAPELDPEPATFDSGVFGELDAWTPADAVWAQGAGDFMDIGLDGVGGMAYGVRGDVGGAFGIGVGADAMGGLGPGAGGAGGGWDGGMDIDAGMDDIFTEADFDFWDAKPQADAPIVVAAAEAASASASRPMDVGLPPSAGPASLGLSPPPLFGESGPGPPRAASPTSWAAGGVLGDGFVPREPPRAASSVPPELLPPSPTRTPESHAGPATPAAHVALALAPAPEMQTGSGPNAWDPIPFARAHRIADGKYTAGKFALPSPPDEEDRTRPLPAPLQPPFAAASTAGAAAAEPGWRRRYYNAVTDPSVGMVRKLIGVKRKSFDQGVRAPAFRMSAAWVRGDDEWESNVVQDRVADAALWGRSDDEDGESDEQEEEEDDDDDDDDDGREREEVGEEGPWAREDEPMLPGTRPATPPPAYLPLGPTLLHTQFQHALLLPLSAPLRAPRSAAGSPPGLAAASAPTSVPTPVSPAALAGQTSDRLKSLEAAAQVLVREVVESSVWGDAWRANAEEYLAGCRLVTEVWQADVRRIAGALGGVVGVEGPLDLRSVFAPAGGEGAAPQPRLQVCEPPMLSVGKADAIIQVLPTALKFWEKLGLGPRAGKKDVVAFVFFEDDRPEKQDWAEQWLACISTSYVAKNLGSHTAGRNAGCVRDGIVPVKFDAFRRTLTTFVASLPASTANYVFYIAVPASILSLSSPVLRQIFSAVKRAQKRYSEAQILFQFLPAHLVHCVRYPAATQCGFLVPFAMCVYERILRPVDRVMSRRFFDHGERVRNFFQEPAVLLARPAHSKVHLIREFSPRALDVLERHMLLHVGYRVSACGRWIFAACLDERGEAHDLGAWLSQSEPSPEAHLVQQLWRFALNFAKKASVEWRIVFAKLGSMDPAELDAWMEHLASAVPDCAELPMVHVSLLAVESDASWTFIAPAGAAKRPMSPSRSSKSTAGTFFHDVSSTTYFLSHASGACLLPPGHAARDLGAGVPYIPDPADAPPRSSAPLPMRPLRSTTLVRAPAHTDYTSISMLHLHLLHTAKSARSSLAVPDAETHDDITRNYHDLAVLAQARWWLKADPILPFHLGALQVMAMALSRCDLPMLA